MIKRIGFACKLHTIDKNNPFALRGFKLSILEKPNHKLLIKDIIEHNSKNIVKQIQYISKLDKSLRMLRISSDILPFYTHPKIKPIYNKIDPATYTTYLKIAGDLARKHNIRLSMHPGQYSVLNSIHEDVVERAISDIEYHAFIATSMGFKKRGEFVINIHVGSKEGGLKRWRTNFKRLSKAARQMLTVENDEVCFGIEDVVKLGDLVPVVLDLHHDWCFTKGRRLKPKDKIVRQVFKTWGTHRPKIHASQCRKEYCTAQMPDYNKITKKVAAGKLRAHSDIFTKKFSQYVLTFLPLADIMVEAKHKQIASFKLSNQRT